MQMTFRWFGADKDTVSLDQIKQIPGVVGVVPALHYLPAGEAWEMEDVQKMYDEITAAGLTMECIESVNVHEDIKLGLPTRDKLIENYKTSIRNLAKVGVKVICYNFMPVFDWLRTNMKHVNEDGSNSLSYSYEEFLQVDPNNLHLPGWDESYSKDELQNLLKEYKKISHDKLFQNLVYFLNKVIPVCEECNVNMAIHPDDAPWDVFNLPRIISNQKDLDKLFKAVPSTRNGLTLCTGSFGAGRENDLIKFARKYTKQGRVHFVHLRNVKWVGENNSFYESGHYSNCGSLDMARIVEELVKNGFNGYVRPDHGRNIFGEDGKPGYGLYDRALGATYINGLFEAYEKIYKK